MNDPSMPGGSGRRKRGAPHGNANAVTHGVYAVKHPWLMPDLPQPCHSLGAEMNALVRALRGIFDHPVPADDRRALADSLKSVVVPVMRITCLMVHSNAFDGGESHLEALIDNIAGLDLVGPLPESTGEGGE